MRTELVVLAPEVVEGPLVSTQGAARRHGGVELEREVHALMAAVLLGFPGSIRSWRMPSLSHQAESSDNPAGALEATGEPLSLRMASGRPNCSKTSERTRRTPAVRVLGSAARAVR